MSKNDNKKWEKDWDYLMKSWDLTLKISNFIRSQAYKWDVKIDFYECYEERFYDCSNLYLTLSKSEKQILLLFKQFTHSSKTAIDFFRDNRFHIFLNDIGINYYSNEYHNPELKGLLSLLLLIEYCKMKEEKNKLKKKENYLFAGKHYLDLFNIHRNIFIYGNGFTKALNLHWVNEGKIRAISSKLFPGQKNYDFNNKNGFLLNTLNIFLDEAGYLSGEGLLQNISPVLYNNSYEFKIFYSRLFEKKYNLIEDIPTNKILEEIKEELKREYKIFNEKNSKFNWKDFELEKILFRSRCVMTTNYDDISWNNIKPIKLHGNIENIQTGWFLEKYNFAKFDIINMLNCNNATFYGFSGDYDYHIIHYINGISGIKWINIIDLFEIENKYLYFLKWLKWKRLFQEKEIFIYTKETAEKRINQHKT